MLKIKVCGLKYPENIKQLFDYQPDYMGFIFYSKSPRYCPGFIGKDMMRHFPEPIQKVGVFVNENMQNILNIVSDYSLNLVQLHGNESVELCAGFKQKGISVIKAFQIDNDFDFKIVVPYKAYCDYFLFDTKSINYGGSGISFDWNKLKEYDNEKPFYLSGGIDINSIEEIMQLKNLNLFALDINSKFETKPGLKDVESVAAFIQKIRKSEFETGQKQDSIRISK